MRFGIFLGFLAGAAVASLATSSDTGEPPGEEPAPGGGIIARLKRHIEEARAAAREASEQKQAEMLQEWEEIRHHDSAGRKHS